MIKGQETFGNVVLSGTFIYSVRRDNTIISPTASTVSATAFQTGAQANPFYVNPPGVSTTTQTVDFNAEGIIPLAFDREPARVPSIRLSAPTGMSTIIGCLSVTDTFGADTSYSYTIGGFCSSCALLALNGTTNTFGKHNGVIGSRGEYRSAE
jgi:iron complex outermembrane receptor protein